MEGRKVYIGVNGEFRSDGVLLPRAIYWEAGETYRVNRVLRIDYGSEMKIQSQVDRYTIIVGNRQLYLYFERNGSLTEIGKNSLTSTSGGMNY